MKFVYTLLVLALGLCLAFSAGAKKCPGHFGKGATNLCGDKFPDQNSEKIWLIKFYAPWCGHCTAMKEKFQDVGKQLKDHKNLAVGGVDCTATENQSLCQKHGVSGYPTLKAFIYGKAKAYNGARETEPMKAFLLEMDKKAGGAAKCNRGIFKSGVIDSVSALCVHHFPDNKSKNPWVVGFYNQADYKDKKVFNEISSAFGNYPADKLKKSRVVQKQRERLEKLAETYSFEVSLPAKGPLSTAAIAKVGAVCCDCNEEAKKFCAGKNVTQFPTYQFINKGKNTGYDKPLDNAGDFISFVLSSMGHIKAKNEDL